MKQFRDGIWSAMGIVLFFGLGACAEDGPSERARWAAEAARVKITRDDWGIAHVHGKTDADAVFGMVYAQCEDDFNRVETNYLNAMGRLAEAEGEDAVWQDLRMKMFVTPEDLKQKYAGSPGWLRSLMDAWADGLNFYLARHAEVKPRVIGRFEPWMALSFTEGSIGGDIERVDLGELAKAYGAVRVAEASDDSEARERWPRTPLNGSAIRQDMGKFANSKDSGSVQEYEPTGSNGIAIAAANTAEHHALLLINPHTTFYFRSELQMTSEEGLDAYGAVTWGQMFVYQGFNARTGWMHTSSGVDAVDEYRETIEGEPGHLVYRYGSERRPVITKQISVPYKTSLYKAGLHNTVGAMAKKTFTVLYTQHGPLVRKEGGQWVSVQLMQEPVKALEQSFLRTKARSYKEFEQTMELRADSSNNTVFADADGDIAYWHGNFIPRRDTRFDFTKPVDGSDPATDWHGLMRLEETPHLLNPKSGYLFNVNDSPWNGAGESSLRKYDFPVYVETGVESARGVHAMRVLQGRKDFTADSLLAAAYDSYLPWFEGPLPALLKAWDGLGPKDEARLGLAEQIAVLRGWDRRWGTGSVATSLAVFWGEEIRRRVGEDAKKARLPMEQYVATRVPAEMLLRALQVARDKLTADFGRWATPWGEINRFQRVSGDLVQPFDDRNPSVAVGFTGSYWGSLATFVAHAWPRTKRWYGTYGNSFVAVVEFGERVHARAIMAGGESGHVGSRHFADGIPRYAAGDLREVYFYPEQRTGHTEREYRPGE